MLPLTRLRKRTRFFGVSGPSFALDFVNGGALDPRITFTRASTATFFDSAGVLQSAAINVPRLDYDPATLLPRGFLVEEQRTNLLTYSEGFNNAAWTKSGSTVTADSTTAPSGTATADTLTEDTSTGQHRVFRSVSGTTNTNPYTCSIFAKASTRTRVYIGIVEGTSFVRQGNAVFDLSAGTIVTVGGGSGGATGGSATIQNVGNGWYRCTYTLTLGGTDTAIFVDLNLVSTGTTISYTGNGTGSLFLYGAQLEAGAFPTSYIPTTTTALTRAADLARVNTLSPWYNAAEGTFYSEVIFGANAVGNTGILSAYQAANPSNNRISIRVGNTIITSGGTLVANFFPSASANSVGKWATAYKLNDFAFSANGAAPSTDTSGAVPSNINELEIGGLEGTTSFQLNGHLRRITYYPRRLSNAELVSLTS